MTEITKIRGADSKVVAEKINSALSREGYRANVEAKDHHVSVAQIRLAEGHNLQQSQGTKSGYRKTNALAWDDWVQVNNTINRELDKLKTSANVKSLKGKFKIREGKKAFTEEDWEDLKYENVGSQMYPVTRYDYITKHEEPIKKKKLGEMS